MSLDSAVDAVLVLRKECDRLRSERDALRAVAEAARHADQVLCDAMTFYALEMCDYATKTAAGKRAQKAGGGLAYMGRARTMLRDALATWEKTR